MVECNLNKSELLTHTHWRTVARGPTRTRRDAIEAQRRDNDGRVRSNETPHGIDGGGVPLTSEGVIAAASSRRALVGRHPRRFRAASRPTSRAHRYPGAAPRSRPGASASGPLELSASVSVLICLIYSSCILPLHYRTTHRRARASPRLAPARPGAQGALRAEPACPGRKQPQNPWGASARASGRPS